jgi:hypothetical protein
VSRWLADWATSRKHPAIRTEGGREGEWSTWESNREERSRVCRDQVGRPGVQVAESGPEQVDESCRGWGKSQGYRASIEPVASGLKLPSVH